MKRIVKLYNPYSIEEQELTAEPLIDAIDSIVWYNGLYEDVIAWKNAPLTQHGQLSPPYFEQDISYTDRYGQLQAIWMISVCLFGDYGTSPRTGWIEPDNIQNFYEFIDSITVTAREAIALDSI